MPHNQLGRSLPPLNCEILLNESGSPLPEIFPLIRFLLQVVLLLFHSLVHPLLLIELILDAELDLREVHHFRDVVQAFDRSDVLVHVIGVVHRRTQHSSHGHGDLRVSEAELTLRFLTDYEPILVVVSRLGTSEIIFREQFVHRGRPQLPVVLHFISGGGRVSLGLEHHVLLGAAYLRKRAKAFVVRMPGGGTTVRTVDRIFDELDRPHRAIVPYRQLWQHLDRVPVVAHFGRLPLVPVRLLVLHLDLLRRFDNMYAMSMRPVPPLAALLAGSILEFNLLLNQINISSYKVPPGSTVVR